ncbi:MAG: GDP-mannose 4,6-dehydratase, partial [Synergistaceae bacterium]|nr:GDP-mannose 4,6-dehydratase [Synergistaceae bacterium]
MNTSCKTYLLTGAAGFIGSNLVHYLVSIGHKIVVLDKLTYAGNLASLDGLPSDKFSFIKGDICDTDTVYNLLNKIK